jgi:hypothetical protein
MDSEVLLEHRDQDEDFEVSFGVLVFGGVLPEFGEVVLGFRFYPSSPLVEGCSCGRASVRSIRPKTLSTKKIRGRNIDTLDCLL